MPSTADTLNAAAELAGIIAGEQVNLSAAAQIAATSAAVFAPLPPRSVGIMDVMKIVGEAPTLLSVAKNAIPAIKQVVAAAELLKMQPSMANVSTLVSAIEAAIPVIEQAVAAIKPLVD